MSIHFLTASDWKMNNPNVDMLELSVAVFYQNKLPLIAEHGKTVQ